MGTEPTNAACPATGARARALEVARAAALGLVAATVLGALVVVVAGAVRTSSARVSATTSARGSLAAGTVELGRPDEPAGLLFDADGLYPGRVIEGCTVVEYGGSVPVELRLSVLGRERGALDPFVDVRLESERGGSCDDDGAGRVPDARFDGSLARLRASHRDFASGLTLASGLRTSERVAVRTWTAVVDDDRAGGLSTEVTFSFEARPR